MNFIQNITNLVIFKSNPNHIQNYRPDIDGLRALAVLLVVGFHAFPKAVPGGFIGVDIFFVISGYLISKIILNDLKNQKFSFKVFYARRIKRIFPSLLLVLYSSIIFGWFALLADEYKLLGQHTFAGATFISNILLWSESGYFDSAAEFKPLLHLWSLGIEEQFYLLWPIFLYVTWRFSHRLNRAIILLMLASFILNIYGIWANPVKDFYSPQTRFWELLAGGLLAWISIHKKNYHDILEGKIINLVSLAGLCLIAFGVHFINKNSAFPGWWALLPVFGASFLIFANAGAWINRNLLSNRLMVWFGLISFPLYLWHWPLLAFARIIEGGEIRSHLRFWLMVLAIGLSWLTYEFLEKPIRFGGNSKRKLYWLISLLLVLALFSGHLYYKNGYPFRAQLNNTTITEEVRDQLVGADWRYKQNASCINTYNFPDSNNYGWWFCMQSSENLPEIIILGSSFANHLYPGFFYNKDLFSNEVLSIGTCSVGLADNDPRDNGVHPCAFDRPTKQRAFIHQLLSELHSVKFAILSGFEKNIDQSYIDRIRDEISTLEQMSIKVVVFTPHIQPGFDPKLCYTTPLRKTAQDCSFPIQKKVNLAQDFAPLKEAILKTNPKVVFFDPNEMYCNEQSCSYLLGGLPLNRDSGHFSEFGSMELQRYFTEWAKINIPEILGVSK
uniref:acyltransferase family protein n=1 Tax=Polynucleobacter sp. TaxID=2029855 RepID=UPI0040472219